MDIIVEFSIIFASNEVFGSFIQEANHIIFPIEDFAIWQAAAIAGLPPLNFQKFFGNFWLFRIADA